MADSKTTPKSLEVVAAGLKEYSAGERANKARVALESQNAKLKRIEKELYDLTPGSAAYDRKLSDYRVQQRVVQQVQQEVDALDRASRLASSAATGARVEVRTETQARRTQEKIVALETKITTARQLGDTATVTSATAELNKLREQQKAAPAGDAIFRGRLDREYMGMPTTTNPWDFIAQGKFSYSQSDYGGYFDANGREVYLLADPKGNLNDKTIVDVQSFEASAYAAPKNIVKAQQKAMGMPATGIPTPEYVNNLKAYASQASRINYSISLLPEAERGGRTAYTLDGMIKDMVRGGAVGGTTSRTITQFSDAELDEVLDQYYAEYAGKGANAQQKAAFRKAARARAKAAPDVVSDFGTTRSVQRGFGETELRQMAQAQAVKDPASEAFLNSTKYLDEFLRIIDNPVA